jgi:hypothetical protein
VPLSLVSDDAHPGTLVTVHAQPVGAATETVPFPPEEPYATLVGAISNVQPDWWMATSEPAIVIVPVRAALASFGAPTLAPSVNGTTPLPITLELGTTMNDELLRAVHPQPGRVFTAIDPLPPAASYSLLFTLSE